MSEPTRAEILRRYAEGCWKQFVQHPAVDSAWAFVHREEWVSNCMEDAERAIASGRDTLERIAEAGGEPKCPYCGGSGVVDSGGQTPWGQGIDLPCPACVPTGGSHR